jgi:TonB family protein
MFTLPSYTGKVIENADGTFLSAGLGSIPASLEGLLNQIVHPMPALQDVDQSQPQVQKQSFGKVQLECVMLARPMGATTAIPMGLFPTYCFDPGTTTLRASYNLGSEAILRNGVGRFQQRLVATSISINNGPVKLATAKISTLAGMMPDASMFVKTDDMVSEKMALISGAVMAGTIIKKVPPQYPEGARQRHVSGTVVLRAYIGRDGHIYSLRLMSAGDPELAVAAIAAVRDWTYKPYLLNGEPTEVDTTITVNFSFGPG